MYARTYLHIKSYIHIICNIYTCKCNTRIHTHIHTYMHTFLLTYLLMYKHMCMQTDYLHCLLTSDSFCRFVSETALHALFQNKSVFRRGQNIQTSIPSAPMSKLESTTCWNASVSANTPRVVWPSIST